MRAPASYDEPFAWWGPVWAPPAPRSVLDLIREGVLPVEAAALLWALLARRASVAVVAGPSGAGKTTLLTALLDFLPPGTRRLYLRGCYEPFAFLDDPAVEPGRTVLLVNEISAHLPTYLWGPGVRRALAATHRGFTLAATLHAQSPTELVRLLAGYPLRVPPTEIARFDLVVVVEARIAGGEVRRRIGGVAALASTPDGGVAIETVASGRAPDATLAVDYQRATAAAARLGGAASHTGVALEISARAGALGEFVASPPPDLATALAAASRRWESALPGG